MQPNVASPSETSPAAHRPLNPSGRPRAIDAPLRPTRQGARERVERAIAEHNDKVALLAEDIEFLVASKGAVTDDDLINLRWSPLLLNELKSEALEIVRAREIKRVA